MKTVYENRLHHMSLYMCHRKIHAHKCKYTNTTIPWTMYSTLHNANNTQHELSEQFQVNEI